MWQQAKHECHTQASSDELYVLSLDGVKSCILRPTLSFKNRKTVRNAHILLLNEKKRKDVKCKTLPWSMVDLYNWPENRKYTNQHLRLHWRQFSNKIKLANAFKCETFFFFSFSRFWIANCRRFRMWHKSHLLHK